MKKAVIILILCSIGIFMFASTVGSLEYGHVYVAVITSSDALKTNASVTLDGRGCWNIGGGYYTTTTSVGRHTIYVNGRPYRVYVGYLCTSLVYAHI